MTISKLPTVFSADEARTRAPREWPRFMTARVAADYCDASTWTIRRHVKPCGRRGRSFVYAIEAVESWMRGSADGAVGATSIESGGGTRRSRAEDPSVNLEGGRRGMAA